MLVAWIINHRGNGFFIFRPGEGWEYVMTLTFCGLVLAVVGAGEWSLDEAFGIGDDLFGVPGLLIALIGGAGGAAALLLGFWRPEPKESWPDRVLGATGEAEARRRDRSRPAWGGPASTTSRPACRRSRGRRATASRSGSGLPRSANGWRSSVARGPVANGGPEVRSLPRLPAFQSTARVVEAMSSSAAWESTPSTQRRTLPSGVASPSMSCAT